MKKLIILIACFSGAVVHANNSLEEKYAKTEAKAVMDGVFEAYTKVIPYVYSGESSLEPLRKDQSKKEDLLKNLTDLSLFFKNAQHVQYFQRPGFRPTLETMNSHLSDTINSLKSNNFSFAQRRLSALSSLCISCHSQLSSQGASGAFGNMINKSKREEFGSDYLYGNYLFLVRHFEDSQKYLNLAMETALKESKTDEIFSTLRRLISIHTKISFNYENAKAFIEKYSADPRMPSLAKELLKDWDKALLSWKNFKPSEVKSIESFIKDHLSSMKEIKEQVGGGQNDITLLISSGILSKYLQDNPKSKSAPEILYWLSIAEKRLSNVYFFTLSDLYLKDCVRIYSKSPFAKKCYNLYEENIVFGYTGSSGTDIPVEEKNELARLKSYLK